MRGVILTGRGDRLKPITGDRPTRLTTVGGCTIFERQRGFPWIEIDSPNDYWRACTHIAPVLDDAVPGAGAGVRRAADHV